MAKSFDEFLKEKYTSEQIIDLEKRVEKRANEYLEFKKSISSVLHNYMEDNHIGFNEIQDKLGTSASQTNRLLNASGNFTIDTIFKISEITGKQPRIIFE